MKTYQATVHYSITTTITVQAENEHRALEAIVCAPCPASPDLVSMEGLREVHTHKLVA